MIIKNSSCVCVCVVCLYESGVCACVCVTVGVFGGADSRASVCVCVCVPTCRCRSDFFFLCWGWGLRGIYDHLKWRHIWHNFRAKAQCIKLTFKDKHRHCTVPQRWSRAHSRHHYLTLLGYSLSNVSLGKRDWEAFCCDPLILVSLKWCPKYF